MLGLQTLQLTFGSHIILTMYYDDDDDDDDDDNRNLNHWTTG
jgi:hypothetical protein